MAMSNYIGSGPLWRALNYTARKCWFDKAFEYMASDIIRWYGERDEVVKGCVPSVDGATASAIDLDITAGTVLLNGVMCDMGAVSGKNIMSSVDNYSAHGIGFAIYSDGGKVSDDAYTLSSSSAYITLILCNSNNAGAEVTADGEGYAYVAVVAGTGSDDLDEDHLTSIEISDALEASSSLHEKVTRWTHVAQIVHEEDGGASAAVTMNRDNAVSAA